MLIQIYLFHFQFRSCFISFQFPFLTHTFRFHSPFQFIVSFSFDMFHLPFSSCFTLVSIFLSPFLFCFTPINHHQRFFCFLSSVSVSVSFSFHSCFNIPLVSPSHSLFFSLFQFCFTSINDHRRLFCCVTARFVPVSPLFQFSLSRPHIPFSFAVSSSCFLIFRVHHFL